VTAVTALRAATLVLALLLGLPLRALAQDARLSDEEVFGAPAAKPKPEAPAQKPDPPGAEGSTSAEQGLLERLARADNSLQVGGTLYLRANLFSREDAVPVDWTVTAPFLLDLYLDAHPADRVRGFVLARTFFDPTQTPSSTGLVPGTPLPANLRGVLDQLWIKFDIDRVVFVTVGRQHVKWGVGRFWNPTDYLHTVKRDPLAVFDARVGTTMLKVHVPWEKRGWNFYAMGLLEPLVAQSSPSLLLPGESAPAPTAANTLRALGAGARAEIVVGPAELGLDAVAQPGIRPRFGADLSAAIWEIDVRGEVALRTSTDVPLYRGTLPVCPPAGCPADAPFPRTYEPSGVWTQAVLGAEWSHKYSDEDTFTVGAEYFWNEIGYGGASLYPWLLVRNAFTPFYLGRHYLAAYLLLPQPGPWNLHAFKLSGIANLSDRSVTTRLDWNYTLLTYLYLEAYVQSHFGSSASEFRLGLEFPGQEAFGIPHIGAPVVDVGLGLRLRL